jgi:hypothetical protein
MTTRASSTERGRLWIVLMLTPSGYVEAVEVRSPSEALALDMVQSWKPCHRVATDSSGRPLISSCSDRQLALTSNALPRWVPRADPTRRE